MNEKTSSLDALINAIGGSRRPRLLFITHAWGGGVERHVQDLLELVRASADVLVLRGFLNTGVELSWYGESVESTQSLRVGGFAGRAVMQWRDALRDIHFSRIHIHHLHGWPSEILDLIATLPAPIDVTLHDYFYPCPQYHLSDENNRYCGEPDEAGCRACVAKRPHAWGLQIEAWRETMGALLARAERVIAPSNDVATRIHKYFPAIHSLLWPHPESQTAIPAIVKVAILGGLSQVKGLDVVRDVVAHARAHEPSLVFRLIGHASEPLPEGIAATGTYDDRELPRLVATERPDVIWFPSQVPETFSYTLSVAMASGVRIVASNLGSIRERLKGHASHQLLSHDVDAATWIKALATVVEPPRENTHVVDSTFEYTKKYLAVISSNQTPAPSAIALRSVLNNGTEPPKLPERGIFGLFQIGRYAGHRASLDAVEQQLEALPLHESHLVGRSLFNTATAQRDQLQVAYEHTKAAYEHKESAYDNLTIERDALIAQNKTEVARMQAEARNAMLHIAYLESELLRITTSKSWRYTEPLRLVLRIARIVPRLLRTGIRVLTTDRNIFSRAWTVFRLEGRSGLRNRLRREIRKSSEPSVRLALPSVHRAPIHALDLPTSEQPVISILIPVFEQHETTFNCLKSIAANFPNVATEIVISDDASLTPVSEALALVRGIRVVRHETNLGFIRNVNAGARECRGEYLLILNNDTITTPQAIEAMLGTFHLERNVGMVGAKLLNADGSLQEAGGIVWQDGSAWNWGRGEHPLDPRFNFVRDADYCSGAALMILRELFLSMNGFDEHYLPAYYEDTDLAFRIRQQGLRVVYQPRASIYHLEGVSHGRDATSGIKAYQTLNAKKFYDRWSDTLASHRANGDSAAIEARRQTNGSVLVVEACMITPDQDSGSIRLLNLMRLMREDGHHVTFLAENLEGTGKYRYSLEALGIEVLYDAWAGSVRNVLRERGHEFSVIILCRHYVAAAHLQDARRYAPQARIVLDTVDLHYLREERQAELAGTTELAKRASATKALELAMVSACDATLVVSAIEQSLLQKVAPDKDIFLLSNVHQIETDRPGFDQREGVIFVGGFRHPPNVDAVKWFAQSVLPHLRVLDPALETTIIGSNMTDELSALTQPGLKFAGHVPELKPFLHRARVSIAPLRYGAGVKGKVNEAMNFGIPVVATPIAVEGMHLRAGIDCLVASEPAAFAKSVVDAHSDRMLWETLSKNGSASVEQHFSFEVARQTLRSVLQLKR